jgi:hypothetical protein
MIFLDWIKFELTCRDTEERDVVVDFPAGHVEDGVVRLPDEEGAHRVEAGVANGLTVFVGSLVRHQVCYFLKMKSKELRLNVDRLKLIDKLK